MAELARKGRGDIATTNDGNLEEGWVSAETDATIT